MAHMSEDRQLCHLLSRSDCDVFKSIAATWKRKHIDDVTEKERNEAKQICYGMLYGIGVKGISFSVVLRNRSQINVTNTEASRRASMTVLPRRRTGFEPLSTIAISAWLIHIVFVVVNLIWPFKCELLWCNKRNLRRWLKQFLLFTVKCNLCFFQALSEQLCVIEEEAVAFLLSFKSAYPGVRTFIEKTVMECRKRGYVVTLGGRRRFELCFHSLHHAPFMTKIFM